MSQRHSWLILGAVMLLLGTLTATVTFASATPRVYLDPAASLAATASSDGAIEHVIKWGETLALIARRYGVSVRGLAAYNRLANPDRIYAGQVLRIPVGGQPTPVPPAPTPLPAGDGAEEIVIQTPGRGVTVTSPVEVSGLAAAPFEQTVFVAVLDASGGRIGQAAAIITGEYGQRGPFSVTVPFALPVNSQPGRIQVFTESPRDGALAHLSSVTVALQGSDLDALLEQLAAAVQSKDYARLQALMGPTFNLSGYRAERVALAPAAAIEQLRQTYLGPGMPRLDFSVDARGLLGSRVMPGPEVTHLVYSTGWGLNRNDDGFLMIGDVDGQARWLGLLYVPHALIDYRVVARATTR